MKRFTVGIVGAGVITQNTHLPVLLNMPNVVVSWLTDADMGKAKLVADAYGIHHIKLPNAPRDLPDADIVLLAIPLVPRRSYYEQLAARGTAVFAEKPFAINSQDHKRFQQLFAPHKIGCGYMRRMYATNQLLRQAVKDLWFGPLRRIDIHEGGRTTKTGVDHSYQDLSVKEGGGILINLGCHALDLAFYISGARKFTVNENKVEFDGDTDRKAQGNITLSDLPHPVGEKCQFNFCVSWLDSQSNTIELEFDNIILVGPISPGGSIEIRGSNQDYPSACLQDLKNNGAKTINQAFYLEWREFLTGLEESRPSIMSSAESLVTAELVDKLLDGQGKRAQT